MSHRTDRGDFKQNGARCAVEKSMPLITGPRPSAAAQWWGVRGVGKGKSKKLLSHNRSNYTTV